MSGRGYDWVPITRESGHTGLEHPTFWLAAERDPLVHDSLLNENVIQLKINWPPDNMKAKNFTLEGP